MGMRGASFTFSTPILWAIGCIFVLGAAGLISFGIAGALKDRMLCLKGNDSTWPLCVVQNVPISETRIASGSAGCRM